MNERKRNLKKKTLLPIAALAAVLCVYVLGSGFMRNGSVFISDFSVSPDGTEMTVTVGVAASAGFVRKAAIRQQEDGKLYLDFYYAFGGVNGSLGAKQQFTVPLEEDTALVAIHRNSDCYEEVLTKDADGVWRRVR